MIGSWHSVFRLQLTNRHSSGGHVSAYEAGGARHVRVTLLDSKAMRVVVACVVLCLIAGVAFLAGERQGNRTTVLTGIAYTGMNEATVTVPGWSYGIPGDVTWFD